MSEILNKFEQMQAWYTGQLGRLLYQTEQQQLSRFLPGHFGYYLVQLGGPSDITWLQSSPISHHFQCGIDIVNRLDVAVDVQALPFYHNSIDMVILPHLLELTDQPAAIVQQAASILIPEGLMIIIGFNPASLWGLWRLFIGNKQHFPFNCYFHRLGRLRRLLEKNDCEIDDIFTYFFIPPTPRYLTDKKMHIIETIGKSCCAFGGGAYMLVARKRIKTFTPIKAVWKKTNIIQAKGKVIEPTTRNSE